MSQEEVINKYDRLQSFIHRMLNRLVLLGIVFTAGAVTGLILRYKSLSDTLDETRVELDQANQHLRNIEKDKS